MCGGSKIRETKSYGVHKDKVLGIKEGSISTNTTAGKVARKIFEAKRRREMLVWLFVRQNANQIICKKSTSQLKTHANSQDNQQWLMNMAISIIRCPWCWMEENNWRVFCVCVFKRRRQDGNAVEALVPMVYPFISISLLSSWVKQILQVLQNPANPGNVDNSSGHSLGTMSVILA